MISLLLCFVFSQKAVITNSDGNPAPVEVPLGEPIFLSSNKSETGEKCVPVWEIDPPERAERARFFDGGKSVVIGTGMKPVAITVRLIVAKADNASVARVTIKVGGVQPGPDPPPGPGPGPSKFGVDAACKIALTGVRDQSKKAALLVAYKSLALRTFNSKEEAMKANVQAVKDALGGDLPLWSAWTGQMNVVFKNLEGRITAADMPAVFTEMVVGLE